jgi:small subunit ribosomal protein S6
VREYETIFVVQPEISEEGRQAITERLDGVLSKHKATRFELDDWGKRKLAYEIRKFQKGHYLALSYGHEGTVVPELERTLRLDDSVLRFLTVQVTDELEDVEQRTAVAEERERIQAEKAAVRAREAEEIRARAAAEAKAAQEAQAAAAEAPPEEAADAADAAVDEDAADAAVDEEASGEPEDGDAEEAPAEAEEPESDDDDAVEKE